MVVAAASLARAGESPELRLPDLDQFTPYRVDLERRDDGTVALVFASAVSNVGDGPLVIEGSRALLGQAMTVRQVVVRGDGSRRSARARATLRYVRSPDHAHWHLLGFDRYELRGLDGSLVLPDRKTGFCLGDRKRLRPPPRATPRIPAYTSRCGLRQPGLLSIREGISVGYIDDYKPALEGQELDVTDVAPGRYVLVHRVNAELALRETDTTNNAASVLLELGPDSVRIVRSCPDTDRCAD